MISNVILKNFYIKYIGCQNIKFGWKCDRIDFKVTEFILNVSSGIEIRFDQYFKLQFKNI